MLPRFNAQPRSGRAILFYGASDRLTACGPRNGQVTGLEIDAPPDAAAARGPLAVAAGEECSIAAGTEACPYSVVLADAETGYRSGRDYCPASVTGCGTMRSIVLGRHLAAAWIVTAAPRRYVVVRSTIAGSDVVASGPQIDPESLRAGRSGWSFSWTDGEQQRSAAWPASPVLTGGVRVSPARGGPRTTFRVRFTSPGHGVGTRPGGEQLRLTGPAGTPCAGAFRVARAAGFGLGPARFRLGPRPPAPGIRQNIRSLRVVTAWCPGEYRGSVVQTQSDATGASRSLGEFGFRVRRGAGAGAARPLREPVAVKRVVVLDRDVRVRPRRGDLNTVFRVSFAVRDRGGRPFELLVVPPGECSSREYTVRFRAGRATLLVGRRVRARRHERDGQPGDGRVFPLPAVDFAPFPERSLCLGRWVGYVDNAAFDFEVTR